MRNPFGFLACLLLDEHKWEQSYFDEITAVNGNLVVRMGRGPDHCARCDSVRLV